MARRKEDVAGIYHKPKTTRIDLLATPPDETVEQFRRWSESIGRTLNLDAQLSAIEKRLVPIVEAAGGKTEYLQSVPHDADERAKHAAVGLQELALVRWNMERGETRDAVLRALRLGQIDAEVNAMRFEPLVKTGRRIVDSSSRGNAGRRSKRQERLDVLKPELTKCGESESKTSVLVARFAKRFHVNERTVWRDIDELRKID